MSHRDRPPDAAELLRQHPRHPPRLPAVRRPGGVQDPRRARGHRARRAGACTPATSSSSTSRSSPGSEEYLDSEKYQIRVRDWDGRRGRGPHPRAVPHAAQRRSAARTPRCSSCATSSIHSSDDENVLVFSKQRRATTDDTVIVVVNLDPHGARETTVHLDLPALGLGWHDTLRRARRDHRRRTGLGPAQLRAARPRRTSPPTS